MSRYGTYDLKQGFIPDDDCPQQETHFEPYIKILEEARIAGQIETMLYEFEQKHGPIESETLEKIKQIFEEKEK